MRLTKKPKTNPRNGKCPPTKSQKAIQLVSNFNPSLAPEVKQIDLIIGNILNPYDVIRVTPVHSSGEGSWGEMASNLGETREIPSPKCRRAH